jgi:hypothetical protein
VPANLSISSSITDERTASEFMMPSANVDAMEAAASVQHAWLQRADPRRALPKTPNRPSTNRSTNDLLHRAADTAERTSAVENSFLRATRCAWTA